MQKKTKITLGAGALVAMLAVGAGIAMADGQMGGQMGGQTRSPASAAPDVGNVLPVLQRGAVQQRDAERLQHLFVGIELGKPERAACIGPIFIARALGIGHIVLRK